MARGNTEDSARDVITNAFTVEGSQSLAQVGQQSEDDSPPEGGWGWAVCLGVFVVNFLTVGQQNSAGVVFDALMDEYKTPRGRTGTNVC